MRLVNALIGFILLTLAVLHLYIPDSFAAVCVFLAGAVLAFITLKPKPVSLNPARLLAVATTAVMFFYFAGFFHMATHFNEHWYHSGTALEAVGMLLSAFAMIPILSSYSCMLKADCDPREQEKRPAFFRVPENIQDNTIS